MGPESTTGREGDSPQENLSFAVARRIDEICDRFESALGRGDVPDWHEYLNQLPLEATDAARLKLMCELICLDLDYRWRHAVRLEKTTGITRESRGFSDESTALAWGKHAPGGPRLEEYLACHPELGTALDVPLKLVQAEYRARHRWGDHPGHQEFLERFPHRPSLLTALTEIDDQLRQAADARESGDVNSFADYDIISEISRGGMGIVYKAHQRSLNRTVALKVILTGMMASHEEVTRFHREAEAAAALEHVGIVPIYGIGQHEGRQYFSMAYVDGPSLAKTLANGPLPPIEAARLLVKLARAVGYAHQRGVVHRDLKPANILVDRDGEPKVTDFGLAKLASNRIRDPRLTATGQILGTPNFMAPEQAAGESHTVTHLADIYALGAILYHAVTGRPPFQSHSTIELLKQVMSQEPAAPTQLNTRIPRDLETICLKCLEKHPAQRYRNARELTEELERFLNGEPIRARPVAKLERFWRWTRRNPWRARVAVLLLVLAAVIPLLALNAFINYRVRTELEQRTESEKEHFDRTAESLWHRRYVAEMNLVQGAWDSGNLKRVDELLNAQRPNDETETDERGFEWYFWWRMYHHSPWRVRPVNHWADSFPWLCGVEDNTVLLWDPKARRTILSTQVNEDWVTALAVSPDGKTLATGGRDAVVVLWDIPTGREKARITAHRGGITSIAFCPDGNQLATAAIDHSIYLSDLTQDPPSVKSLRAGSDGRPAHRSGVWAVVYSPNGLLLASASQDRTVAVWDAHTKKRIKLFEGYELAVRSVAFSSDDRWLASAGDDGSIRLWPLDGSESPKIFREEDHQWRAIAFSRDATTLATSDSAGTVCLWSVSAGKTIRQWDLHKRDVDILIFSPDGQQLVSASTDGTAILHEVTGEGHSPLIIPASEVEDLPRTMRPKLDLTNTIDKVNAVAFMQNGAALVCAGAVEDWDEETGHVIRRGRLTLWDLTHAAPVIRSYAQPAEITTLAVSPTASVVALGMIDGAIVIRDLTKDKVIAQLDGLVERIECLRFASDDSLLWSLSADGMWIAWDTDTAKQVHTAKSELSNVISAQFSPSGRLAVVVRDDPEQIYILNPPAVTADQVLHGHVYQVTALAFSPNQDILASAGADRYGRLWNVAGHQKMPLRGHTHWITCLDFSPDGKRLVTGGRDGQTIVWSVADGQLITGLPKHDFGIAHVAFAADSRRLAVVDVNQSVWIWEAAASDTDLWNAKRAAQ